MRSRGSGLSAFRRLIAQTSIRVLPVALLLVLGIACIAVAAFLETALSVRVNHMFHAGACALQVNEASRNGAPGLHGRPGAIAAGADGFDNQKGWLVLPVVGPWITLAARDDSCPKDSSGHCCTEPGCPGTFAGLFLVFDGLMQGGGAALITFAVAAPRRWAVRGDTTSIGIVPRFQSGQLRFSLRGAF